MGRRPGTPIPPGGSRLGKPNKVTAAIKDMILQALSDVGGVKYLKQQAKDNPTAFMGLLGKILPTQLTGPNDGPIQFAEMLVKARERAKQP